MKHRTLINIATVAFVALFTWSIATTLGTALKGGHDAFAAWRTDNVTLFYGIWVAMMIVVGAPVLYFVGRELSRFQDREEQTALAAKGVGRFAAAALRGDKNAIAKLLKLLDDPTPVVRYQAARALALLDDPETNKELFRKVRYWDVTLKLGLINALKRTSDVRAAKLMRLLAKDRNPMVARRAGSAMPFVGGSAKSMDWLVEQRKREAAKRTGKKPAQKRGAKPTEAAAAGASGSAPRSVAAKAADPQATDADGQAGSAG